MAHLTLKALDFGRYRTWLLDAESRRQTDRAYCFIASWIAFNHFYGTFASANGAAFAVWSKANMNGTLNFSKPQSICR